MAEVMRSRSRARSFRIKPFQSGCLDEECTVLFLERMRIAFQMIWECKQWELNFSAIYNMAYKLVTGKQGHRLYDLCTSFMRRASLCMRKGRFICFATLIRDLTMYIERTFVSAQRRMLLLDYARVAYASRVARLWRRVRYVAVKGARVTLWRAAFDEVRFRPGGSGWLAARESFHAHANA